MNTRIIKYSILALGALVCASLPMTAGAGQKSADLQFKIEIDPHRKGTILCALYDNQHDWLSKKTFRTATADPKAEWVTCDFTGVPEGTYGAAAVHDEDGNGTMTKGAFGIPKEGYTTSRDAQNKGLYPDWGDAVVSFSGQKQGSVQGHMHY